MSLPPFNPNRPRPKADPGEGDDVPCVKCGAVALDTGLECSECGHDNYEAVTGKPFGVPEDGEPSDSERLRMVLATFGKREDNMPLTHSERDVLHAFDARGEFTDSMRLRVIDSAIRAARADGVEGK